MCEWSFVETQSGFGKQSRADKPLDISRARKDGGCKRQRPVTFIWRLRNGACAERIWASNRVSFLINPWDEYIRQRCNCLTILTRHNGNKVSTAHFHDQEQGVLAILRMVGQRPDFFVGNKDQASAQGWPLFLVEE